MGRADNGFHATYKLAKTSATEAATATRKTQRSGFADVPSSARIAISPKPRMLTAAGWRGANPPAQKAYHLNPIGFPQDPERGEREFGDRERMRQQEGGLRSGVGVKLCIVIYRAGVAELYPEDGNARHHDEGSGKHQVDLGGSRPVHQSAASAASARGRRAASLPL